MIRLKKVIHIWVFTLLAVALAQAALFAEGEETEKKANPWLEQISKKQLNRLKTKLDELQQTYNDNWLAFTLGESINRATNKNPQQRRNTTFLLDISRQQPFNIYAVSYIFPELLKVYVNNFTYELLHISSSLSDEAAETEKETGELIGQIKDRLGLFKKIEKACEKTIEKALNRTKNLEKANNRTNDLQDLGYFIKKTNGKILTTLTNQLGSMKEICSQLKLAVEYSQDQLAYIDYNDKKPIYFKCLYIAKIRSVFLGIEKFLEKYDSMQETNRHDMISLYKNRHNKLSSLIGNDETISKKIKKEIKNFEFFYPSKKLPVLDAEEDLASIFKLFSFDEVNKELYLTLLPYVSKESWQNRYEIKDQSKEKPDSN